MKFFISWFFAGVRKTNMKGDLTLPRGISARVGRSGPYVFSRGSAVPDPTEVSVRPRSEARPPFFASRPEREPSNGVLPRGTRPGRHSDRAFRAVRPVRHRFPYPRKKPRDKGHLPVKNREGRARAVQRPPDPHGFSRVNGAFSHSFVWRYEQTGTYRFFVEFSW